MDYAELKIPATDPQLREVLSATLSEAGFDSFVEEEEILLAYIPYNDFKEDEVEKLLEGIIGNTVEEVEVNIIRERNWNMKWESDYSPVILGKKLIIRAPFHKTDRVYEHEIIIEPQMSFGTAHHETTRLMLELMGETNFKGKKVLDMGCGTGILGIYANKLGAADVIAVDNDEWAYNNSLHNIELNDVRHVVVIMGDSTSLTDEQQFDVILANINRNVLIEDIPAFDKHLGRGGEVLLSGFYEDDLGKIADGAALKGWEFTGRKDLNSWVAAWFKKK
jgi:ribosomal protein L11 methyltransferase